jgi:hypothetical protein
LVSPFQISTAFPKWTFGTSAARQQSSHWWRATQRTMLRHFLRISRMPSTSESSWCRASPPASRGYAFWI